MGNFANGFNALLAIYTRTVAFPDEAIYFRGHSFAMSSNICSLELLWRL